jgi:hypothetical protein
LFPTERASFSYQTGVLFPTERASFSYQTGVLSPCGNEAPNVSYQAGGCRYKPLMFPEYPRCNPQEHTPRTAVHYQMGDQRARFLPKGRVMPSPT